MLKSEVIQSPFQSEHLLNEQAIVPTLPLDNVPCDNVTFFDLQPRACSAIQQFLTNSHRALLVLKADDQNEYAPLLEQFIASKQTPSNDIKGVQYWVEQADSFSFARVNISPAQSAEDNFAAQKSVASALYFDQNQLFGSLQIHETSKDIQLNAGLVHQLNGGVLILSVGALLQQFDLWTRLKQILQTQRFDWYSAHPYKPLPCDIPSYDLSLKVILLGSRAELATLSDVEPDLYDLADYSEIESYYSLEPENAVSQWASYVQQFAKQITKNTLDLTALNKLYQILVRESEDHSMINIAPSTLKNWLCDSALKGKSELSAVDFERFFAQRQYQQSFLREQAYADILHEQIYVPTEGEAIGQINGLSVIDYQGAPLSFGEPSRISCIVQFGDGEVVDVDRKSELAGNIHGKGMIIAQSCLAELLDLPSQLPFSASLVFEQSYSEIDGDSASLAAFCVLTSALAHLPIPQSIAITGSIDQFGLVHSVGGVNEKIEGFFTICERRGLTGKQGVIIPSAVVQHLSLTEAVQSAVKNQQFFIWAVDDVFQACEILFNRDLLDENKNYTDENQPISRLIAQRLEQRAEPLRFSWWRRFLGTR